MPGQPGEAPADGPADPPGVQAGPVDPPSAPHQRTSPEPPAQDAARGSAVAREAFARTRAGGPGEPEAAPAPDPDASWSRDDPDDDTSALAGAELLQRELGAQVIEEIEHR